MDNGSAVMRVGLGDIVSSVRRHDIWLHFALSDTKARYSRSTLGPWWITLGTAIGIIGLGLVWSAVMKVELSVMLPNLAVGLTLWYMISGVILESANCFFNQSATIKNYPLPLSLHPLRLLSKHLINFGHNISIIVLVFFIYGFPGWTDFLWSLLGLLILVINLFWVSILVATLGARYRDLGPSIDALMPVIFFLTPILYKKSDILGAAAWYQYNPVATLFSLVKEPLLSVPIGAVDYLSMALLGLAGWVITLMVFSRAKNNIVLWI
jgi:lipopolysaccharide transport system permease protein